MRYETVFYILKYICLQVSWSLGSLTNTSNACMHQIPDVKAGNESIDAVVVDEESVGSLNSPGCGGKILCGDGALDLYLAKMEGSVV